MPNVKITDIQRLRPELEISLKEALERFYGVHIIQRVLSSDIRHTPLEPKGSGDVYQINIRVEIHEVPKEKVQENPDRSHVQHLLE